jgi:hypothetical protein
MIAGLFRKKATGIPESIEIFASVKNFFQTNDAEEKNLKFSILVKWKYVPTY